MPSDDERLASAACASVVAAAGCGKTELIAKAVASSSGRQLVLTHTNAGVEALRRRLRRFGVQSHCAAVDTIDGWCLKYVSAFPACSGGGVPLKQDGTTNWELLRQRMVALLEHAIVREVVRASYCGAFVDEYQDCGLDQHTLVRRLSLLIPTRIIGDPRQAIFGWAGAMPDWDRDVTAAFPLLMTLSTPWRWNREGSSTDLGQWLGELRSRLDHGQPTSLRDGRVSFVRLANSRQWQAAAISTCFEVAKNAGTVVAVIKWRDDIRLLGKMTKGKFQCVEPVEAADGGALLERLELAAVEERPEALLSLVDTVAADADAMLGELRLAVTQGRPASGALSGAHEALRRVRDGEGADACLAAVEQMLAVPGVHVYRRELAWAMMDTLREERAASLRGLRDLFRQRRNLTSHVGRRLARCSVGSTLLVKGMEFDHAIVIDTGGTRGFTANDLYVACTRGARSLTVLSASDTIDPRVLPVDQPPVQGGR